MRKIRKITTMDTQERYFQNSLGHPSLPTALFFLADSRHYLTMLRICRFKEIALSYKWCCSTRVRRRRPQKKKGEEGDGGKDGEEKKQKHKKMDTCSPKGNKA